MQWLRRACCGRSAVILAFACTLRSVRGLEAFNVCEGWGEVGIISSDGFDESPQWGEVVGYQTTHFDC